MDLLFHLSCSALPHTFVLCWLFSQRRPYPNTTIDHEILPRHRNRIRCHGFGLFSFRLHRQSPGRSQVLVGARHEVQGRRRWRGSLRCLRLRDLCARKGYRYCHVRAQDGQCQALRRSHSFVHGGRIRHARECGRPQGVYERSKKQKMCNKIRPTSLFSLSRSESNLTPCSLV